MRTLPRLWHSLTCGCQRHQRRDVWRSWSRLLFPLLTACALVWFLARVIPKPIRATYPCQRAAFPLATAFVIWLLAIKTGLVAWWLSRGQATVRPLVPLGLVLCGGFVAISIGNLASNWAANGPPRLLWQPSDPPNTPVGSARGIYSGRVVWMRDTNATPWNGTGKWWANGTGVNQAAVDRMLSTTLQALSGATNDPQAWDRLFRHYNASRGRGEVGYGSNELIAIKINCNNSYSGYNDIDNHANASPQAVLGLLRQLVNRAGVPQSNIVVCEAIRVIPNCIYTNCQAEFPQVRWVDSAGTGSNGRLPPNWRTNVLTYSGTTVFGRNLPDLVYQATYLINMALLKGHWVAGVTLTAKNHFGTINLANVNTAHASNIQSYQLGMNRYHPFVDLIGSPHLGGKTLLFLIDGLYGTREVESYVDQPADARWTNLFNGQWSASVFASLDPVAIDSVGLDFLRSEFGDRLATGHNANADAYLHEAAQADAPGSGTVYQQGGARLGSLGAHEHWNNAVAKQYSRNLGTGSGIELVKIEASTVPAVSLVTPAALTSCYVGTPLALTALAVACAAPIRQVDFFCGTNPVGRATNAPCQVIWPCSPAGPQDLTAVAIDTAGGSSTSAVVRITIQALPPAPNLLGATISGTNIWLRHSSVSGLVYQVQAAGSLIAPQWLPVGPARMASGTQSTASDVLQADPRYYRAVFVP